VVQAAWTVVQAKTEGRVSKIAETLVVFREQQSSGSFKHDYLLSNDIRGDPLGELARVYNAEHPHRGVPEACQERSRAGGLPGADLGGLATTWQPLFPQHPHQWEFVDQPVINSRVFGDDGMRGPGARVSWFAPSDFPLEFIVGLQNANGNTMRSFAGPAEDGPPFGQQVEAPSPRLQRPRLVGPRRRVIRSERRDSHAHRRLRRAGAVRRNGWREHVDHRY